MAASLIRAPMRWWVWLPIAVLWMLVTTKTALLIQKKLPEPVTYAAIAAAGTLVFGLCYFVVGRYFAPRDGKPKQPAWDGVTWRTMWIGSALVVAIYLLDLSHELVTHLPPEPFMLQIRATEGALNWALLCFSSLVLAPISEELFFRHFLLGAFPVDRGVIAEYASVFTVGVLFAVIHRQYIHFSTYVSLIALSCVFGWARLRSEKLRVPIVLHSLAGALGLTINQLP